MSHPDAMQDWAAFMAQKEQHSRAWLVVAYTVIGIVAVGPFLYHLLDEGSLYQEAVSRHSRGVDVVREERAEGTGVELQRAGYLQDLSQAIPSRGVSNPLTLEAR